MKVVHCPDVEGLDSFELGLEGSTKMMLKLLSDDSVYIEIEPMGHTPDHVHNDKERLVIISGKGEIKTRNQRNPIKPLDFIELDANEHHQILNNGDEVLAFVCFRHQG